MEFLYSLASFVFGYLTSYWQTLQHEKQGIEQGAKAAFAIEWGLPADLLKTHQETTEVFKALDWHNTTHIQRAANDLGRAYHAAIRCEAFADAQRDIIHEQDREEWKRQFGSEMPAVTYHAGYVQALVDILDGMKREAPRFFPEHVINPVLEELDHSQRERLDQAYEGNYFSMKWHPDGRAFGVLLIQRIITRLTPPFPPIEPQ